jgi:hypothetical protein
VWDVHKKQIVMQAISGIHRIRTLQVDQPTKKKPNVARTFGFNLVPRAGLEPARLAAGDFESPESTNFTTWAGIS